MRIAFASSPKMDSQFAVESATMELALNKHAAQRTLESLIYYFVNFGL